MASFEWQARNNQVRFLKRQEFIPALGKTKFLRLNVSCLLLALVIRSVFPFESGVGASSVDHPIASSKDPIYLDGDAWLATSSTGLAIPAHVPGDLITDLQIAGIIDDPYYELTWIRNASLWSKKDTIWTYQRNFTVPLELNGGSTRRSTWVLVLDGIKMGARISVNGHLLGFLTDQFLRYKLVLPSSTLTATNNILQVTFDDNIDEEGRFMACTGGWDWAPYSYSTTNGSTGSVNSFSKGIWKSVYLVEVPTVAITHLTPHTKYLGSYPTVLLQDGQHGGFAVNVTVHVWVPPGQGACGHIEVAGSWGHAVSTEQLQLTEGNAAVSVQLMARAKDIQLWWPAGMGQEQPLYDVTATWKENDTVVTATRRMGFRVFALVTTNDTGTNITQQKDQEGSGSHGMFFRVNGAAIYSRGANVVPMEELEGRISGRAHRIMVKSSVNAGMNTLRVWGGGIFFPRAFYDACDEYGVLVYHDMQYASNIGGPHGPSATSATQEAELRYQIRRLSHHPSIILWDGVNEVVVGPNDPSEIFASFVMTVVAEEDQSRAIWPSSPAAGWVTGVCRLYGTPNGRKLTTHGGGHIWDQGIETHAPYQLGSGWPVVNGGETDDCWDRWHLVHTPPVLNPNTNFGVQEKNVYASEFGVTGSPSFESLSPTLARHHWGVHGGADPDTCSGKCESQRDCTGSNAMTQRNYACDAGIRLWMGSQLSISLNDTGEHALKGQTYLCQLVQALDQKSVIEERRGQNQFGGLVWMLNDIWPSISWGSLEYGSVGFTKGQLLGGRWKPMHYFYKRSLFVDVIATCGVQRHSENEWICYAKNDRPGREFRGIITFTSYTLLGDGTPKAFLKRQVTMSAGPGSVEWFPISMPNPNTTALVCAVHDTDDGSLVSEHLLTLTLPKNLEVPRARVSFQVSNETNADGTVDIHVTSDRVALWVTLTSGAQGRFSDNAFFLPATTKTIQFVPFYQSRKHIQVLHRTLRVEDFSNYGRLVHVETSVS